MFTGLIEDVGVFVAARGVGDAAKLSVRTALPVSEIRIGDSIAVNGACLTVETVSANAGTLTFHTLVETLQRTNLGMLRPGSTVNLERALRLGDRLGGHLVSGHVDMVLPIRAIGPVGADIELQLPLPPELSGLVIPKGSIAVNGISLTIADLQQESLAVRVIPHTWQHTSLRDARVGDAVNIEADMIGKYITRMHAAPGGKSPDAVTWDFLDGAGFGR